MLTDEQKKLVADNEKLIYYGINKFGHHDTEKFYGIAAIALCKAAETYEPNKKIAFSTYALSCIRNEIYKVYKREKPQQKYQFTSIDETYEANGKNERTSDRRKVELQSDDLIEPLENSIVAHDAFKSTKFTEKELTVLRLWLQGYTQKAIAEKVGITRPAASERLFRAIARMRLAAEMGEQHANGASKATRRR